MTGLISGVKPYLNESFVALHINQIEDAFLALPIVLSRARELYAKHTYFSTPALPPVVSKDLFAFIRSLSVSLCGQSFVLCTVVEGRIEECESRIKHGAELWRRQGTEFDYLARLQTLKKTTRELAFRSGRHLAGILRESILTHSFTHEWLDERGTRMLFARLPFWISLLVDQPTTETGGPPDFTFAQKLDELKWVLKSTAAHGWASTELSAHLPRIRGYIAATEEQQSLYWKSIIDGAFVSSSDEAEETASTKTIDTETVASRMVQAVLEGMVNIEARSG